MEEKVSSEKEESYVTFKDRLGNLVVGDRFYFADENRSVFSKSEWHPKVYLIDIISTDSAMGHAVVKGILEDADGEIYFGTIEAYFSEMVVVEISDIYQRVQSLTKILSKIEEKLTAYIAAGQTGHALQVKKILTNVKAMVHDVGNCPAGLQGRYNPQAEWNRMQFFILWVEKQLENLYRDLFNIAQTDSLEKTVEEDNDKEDK